MATEQKKRGRGRPKEYEGNYPGTVAGAPIFRTRLDPDVYEWLKAQTDVRHLIEEWVRGQMGDGE